MSLGLRLTLLNGLVLLVALGLFAGVSYLVQMQAMQGSLDATLQEDARRVREIPLFWSDRAQARLRADGAHRPWPLPAGPGMSPPDLYIQLTDADGTVLARSRNLEESDGLPFEPPMLQRALDGEEWLMDSELDGQSVRVLVAPARRPGAERAPLGMIQVARPLGPVQASLRTLQATFLSVGAVGVLASLLAGWLLARAALRPIDWLAAAAHAIGSAQDFGRRVPSRRGRRDEVGQLADEFNQMLARLQAAYEQLEAALNAQRRFVADASHELRTPLTSLQGNIDLLHRLISSGVDADDLNEHERILADVGAETERLGRLVSDLLLLAQADAGQHLELAPVRVEEVVRDSFRAARFLRERGRAPPRLSAGRHLGGRKWRTAHSALPDPAGQRAQVHTSGRLGRHRGGHRCPRPARPGGRASR